MADIDIDAVYAAGITAVFGAKRKPVPFCEPRLNAPENFRLTFDPLPAF